MPATTLRLPTPTPADDGSDTFEILSWRVFGPGYWKGDYYSPARVARVVANHRTLAAANPNHAPRVKLGHDKQQRLAASLGLPNVGRVTDLRLMPDGWFEIDVRGIPKTVMASDADGNAVVYDLHAAVRDGQYDSGSVELTPRVRHPDRPTEWLEDVFDGIALLGEENPALRTVDRPRPTTANRSYSRDYREHRTDGTRTAHAADPLTRSTADSTPAVFFSQDYSETHPMRDQWIQMVAEKLGLTPDDPSLTTATDEQLKAWADKFGTDDFAAGKKKMYGAETVPTPAAGTGTAQTTGQFDQAAFMSECAEMFSEMTDPLVKRLEAAEAAVTDVKKKGDDATTTAMMSEAVRVVDECVRTGRLMPRLKEQTLADLRKLTADTKVFSDGADKGMTAFQASLRDLAGRQPDAMFSESVIDTPTAKAEELDAWDRRALDATPRGKIVLHGMKKVGAN